MTPTLFDQERAVAEAYFICRGAPTRLSTAAKTKCRRAIHEQFGVWISLAGVTSGWQRAKNRMLRKSAHPTWRF